MVFGAIAMAMMVDWEGIALLVVGGWCGGLGFDPGNYKTRVSPIFGYLEVKSGSTMSSFLLRCVSRRWSSRAAAPPPCLLVALLVEIIYVPKKMKTVAALSLLASASAFAPAQTGSRVRRRTLPNYRRPENVGKFEAVRWMDQSSRRGGSSKKETWTSLGMPRGSEYKMSV